MLKKIQLLFEYFFFMGGEVIVFWWGGGGEVICVWEGKTKTVGENNLFFIFLLLLFGLTISKKGTYSLSLYVRPDKFCQA